ncbi:PREDICTED: probable alpha,alpha-trehalose-phosphate synthase [UDP-forming] 4 [Camelina sativa]|uniref:Probable alpha,alpha-trehalose-phosphate synthase [UDP-forming] 4 n=1 Tax=Camelina sativa TaxID=90675 RepID=A0ABM0UB73_CAMSA|nr:PREDICTED: probable alpha,alpha-trehalose-phosphate synthase [UDP-forming] 4 [Camelina sativa]
MGRPRLLVVSMSLPVTAKRVGEESWSFTMSPGGLVSALLGLKEFETKWIGWPGVDVHDAVGKKTLSVALAEKGCIPVFLEEVCDQYYNGYCNNILWPIFHYMGTPPEYRNDATITYQSQYDAYKKANQIFFDVVKEHYEDGDVIWCHDYHVMLLPQYLKEYNSKMKVGWFLHTPFPSSEMYKTLPSRADLLRSVLTADLVGFHTYDFARHFVNACMCILGIEATSEGVVDQGKFTRVAVFPIGIEPERFINTSALSEVIQYMEKFKNDFGGRKLILGVDRLDTIKGIPQKYQAFEKFLEENEDWRGKVMLLQIAVPTRNGIGEYQKIKDQCHGLVGRINGRFGSISAVPIIHLDRSIDFNQLCALYAITDVLLVTSLRDGMNLVSSEFVACQKAEKGVLILSEFAGAGQSLGAGALLVNPWNIKEVSTAIKEALNMSPEEKERKHKINFQYVRTHSTQQWADDFMNKLIEITTNAELQAANVPHELPEHDVIQQYSKSNNRLLVLGFYGALTQPMKNQERRGDGLNLELHHQLKERLKALCSDPKTTVVVLSRSEKNILDKNFGEYNMWLAAENGMFLRHTSGEWVTKITEHMNLEWIDGVKHVFKYFTERTPGSYFETSEASLVWNYEHADAEFGKAQARDMLQHLWAGPISNASVDVVRGDQSVEVHAVGVTKGSAMERILGDIVHNKSMTTPIDYVLCIGCFLGKDEDVYTFFEPEVTKKTKSFPSSGGDSPKKVSSTIVDLKGENYFSVAIGQTYTKARYFLDSSDDVVQLIHKLCTHNNA